jgi:CRP-like cAMP-binding protein
MLDVLTHFPPFKDLGVADLKIIAPLFSSRTYPAGAVLFEQGERATCLYLLTNGEVVIRYKPYDGEAINLNRIQQGGVFGWSAVLGNATYSSSVVCTQACEVLVICGQDLQSLVNEHPQTGRIVLDRLARAVASRRTNAEAQVKSMLKEGLSKRVSSAAKQGDESMNTPSVTSPKEQQLRTLLDNISAYIEQFHGGSVEFVGFDGETLTVKLGGACLGCPLSPSTLHGWVEGTVHQFFPEVHVEAA